jgi:hypothetical protein
LSVNSIEDSLVPLSHRLAGNAVLSRQLRSLYIEHLECEMPPRIETVVAKPHGLTRFNVVALLTAPSSARLLRTFGYRALQ